MFAQFLPLAFAGMVPAGPYAVPCCCALETLPMGLLPAWLARRQDPTTTPGQGFVVSFIAVGLASVIVALVMVMQSRGADPEVLRAKFLEQIEQMQPQPISQEDKVQMADMLISVLPYIPVLGACVITLLGGVWGMLGVFLGTRRNSPMPPPAPPLPPGAL